jgi:hypothetical protein
MAKVLQIPIEDRLLARIKAKAATLGLTQRQFVINLIVAALK